MSLRSDHQLIVRNRRRVELQLLVFSLLIVVTGVTLTLFGKLVTTVPLQSGSVNVNQLGPRLLSKELTIPRSTANSIVQYRAKLPGRAFASVYRFRRELALLNASIKLDENQLYVRNPAKAMGICLLWLFALVVCGVSIQIFVRWAAPGADPYLLPIVFLLTGVGLMIALTVHDPLRDTFAYSTQAFGAVIIGPIALALPMTKWFRKLPIHRYTYAYAVGAVVLLATLFGFGRGPAATHIQLFGFEPIEVIKVLLVFFIASYLADRRMSLGDRTERKPILPGYRDILPLVAIYIFALSLFGAVKDLGPAVLLFGSFVAMLYLVTEQPIFPLIGVAALLAAGYVGDKLGIGFFATRVEMWLHPWDNTDRLGGQLAQGLWGLSTGGVLGSGLGLGGASFVPRGGSDMAFTSIGEELGLVGALCVLVLYVVLIYRGFEIARAALDDFDRLLASGMTVLLGLQALVITGGATGLIPLTGITLPFVSYGTSSLVVNFFCVGVLLSLSSKSIAQENFVQQPSSFGRSSRRVALTLAGGLLLLVGVVRLVWIQGINDGILAAQSLRIPDADRVYRLHKNPRLVAFALTIPRGAIRDRNGVLLAYNAKPGQGVDFLTDGVSRIYPLADKAADIVYAAEQPRSSFNPIGCDRTLRGYKSLVDLLPLYRQKDLPFRLKIAGADVTLTIDVHLQEVAQDALQTAAVRFGNDRGAAVVLNAQTGELLAAATVPTFNPNLLTDQSWQTLHGEANPAQPLFNRAFAGLYTPGSVFKLVTATAALERHQSDLIFNCTHVLPKISWTFRGHKHVRRNIRDDEEFTAHGKTDLAKAIRVSCNVYFSQLGVALGPGAIEETINQYGLHECPGVVTLGDDLPDCAYGQGADEVTPYQMATVAQTIASGGVKSAPGFFNGSLKQPIPGARILTTNNAAQLAEMMESVVKDGTAAGAFPGLSVAGKTGSAQLGAGKPHSWFVGFSPAEKPSIAFACIVEHGGQGRTAAASVCQKIIEANYR